MNITYENVLAVPAGCKMVREEIENVLRLFLSGDGFISVYDIPHIVDALSEKIADAALAQQPEVPRVNIRCEATFGDGVGAITYLNVLRVEREDDGTLTAVTDHWPAAAGEEIMVNAAHDVYMLPLQPSGLSSGPRFVVHVPGPEQPAAPDVTALVEALQAVKPGDGDTMLAYRLASGPAVIRALLAERDALREALAECLRVNETDAGDDVAVWANAMLVARAALGRGQEEA